MDGRGEVDLNQKERESESAQIQEKLRESAAVKPDQVNEYPSVKALHLLQFSRNHGVWAARGGDDKLEIRRSDRTDDVVYFSTDASKEGLEQAEKRIAKLIADKQDELAHRYGIDFSRQGEDVEKQFVPEDDGSLKRRDMIQARFPRLDELLGIEAALLVSQPSHLSADGRKTVKFYFLERPLVEGDGGDTLANFMHSDKDGRPAVYFWPGSNNFRPITEKDEAAIGVDLGYSIESLIVHELAHHGQNKLGWQDLPRLIGLIEEVGWQAYEDPDTHQTMIIMKGKDGRFFDFNLEGEFWFACSKAGVPLNENGIEVQSLDQARKYTGEEVRKQALVPAVTDYMDNPHEIQAEAMMLFRLNAESRLYVLKESPELYKHVKMQDQHEINLAHGLDDLAQPRYIRAPDGLLVKNIVESAKAVAEFERKARTND